MEHEFVESAADQFKILDLRLPQDCEQAVFLPEEFDEVYQLAADMGGMGFIHSAECEIMRNSALININMIHATAKAQIRKYFFSSSVCVYRDMAADEPEMNEEEAYPALPDNEYGWEKLYAERMAMAYGRKFNMEIRIARFQNCYGPEGTWQGGREKAPAAMCRKVAEIEDGGEIEVWGDGSAIRSYTYVDDMTDGIFLLMHSNIKEPTNIGSPEYVNVKELVQTVEKVSGKVVKIRYIDGPVGVQARNFCNDKIYSLDWKAKFSLFDGIRKTYPWIEQQVNESREIKRAVNY